MSISFEPLWYRLREKKIMKKDLMEKANISSNVVARMGRNGYVDLKTIEKVCIALDCTPNEVFKVIDGGNNKC